jgi:hypothetical protein
VTRTPRKARTAAEVKGAKKAVATKAAETAAMTPKERAAQALKRHKSAEKAAATRKREVTAFELAHHGKKPKKGQLNPRGATGSLARTWVLGGNDEYDSCTATAFANSLLLVSGIRPSDEEVLALYEIAGLVSIKESLEALMDVGLAGVRPLSCDPVGFLAPGFVVGVTGDHTATYDWDSLITWGGKVRLCRAWQVEEAWSIEWPVKERT